MIYKILRRLLRRPDWLASSQRQKPNAVIASRNEAPPVNEIDEIASALRRLAKTKYDNRF